MLEQGVAIAFSDGFCQRRNVFVEAAEHFENGVLVGKENITPHRWIGRRDTREVAKPAGGEFQHFRAGHRLQFVRRADDGVSNQMRQMAGDGEHQIVVIRCHQFHIGAEQTPECRKFFHHLGVGPTGGVRMHHRLTKSSAKPASGPEYSVPATG